MKKSLKSLLLSLSFVGMFIATGCGLGTIVITPPISMEEESSVEVTPEKPEGTLQVNFVEGEGYTFTSSLPANELAAVGEVIDFTVKMSAFYTGYPIVYINGKAIAPDNNGTYHVEMQEDIEVTVAGVQKDVSAMAGTGTFEDAYVVSKPIDLVYIADKVNNGEGNYASAAYVLANDIDCGGEELKIIGDMSTDTAFFSGCFTCYTNADTGEMQASTISNFTINSDNANYVGLFGTVYADAMVQSSGLFYGINLDNFVINARISEDVMSANRSISVGGLIGYGVGANVYLCSATNGDINLYGDNNYFSFAGGLIGYQQAYYWPDQDLNFPSEVVYSTTDVNIRVLKGMALYAGGITGYVATNVPAGATAFIHNSYAYGDISGALRAGGIAGGLGQYTSIGNCYATGNIFAKAGQSLDDILLTDPQYCYANAGGIVGFAENDTIVNDCFFAGAVSAKAVSAGCDQANDIVGGGHTKGQLSASAEGYAINNCLTTADLSSSMSANNTLFKDTFGWLPSDWVFSALNYPTINYASSTDTQRSIVTFHYVADGQTITVEEETKTSVTYFDSNMTALNTYVPVGNYFYTGSFSRTIIADNGYLSYGYFFDAECTKKVPYAYVPQRDIELYIGFADATPILGEYQFSYKGNTSPLSITFDENGLAHYTDGNTTQTAYYFFDGKNILIEGARLARYYDGAIIVDENDTSVVADANFDLSRYNYYDFVGSFTDGALRLYDGVYFTATAPLTAQKDLFRGTFYMGGATYHFYGETATKTQGTEFTTYTYVKNGESLILTNENGEETIIEINALNNFDNFKGVWTKSATVNKTYIFDGMGGWEYEYISYTRNGYSYEEHILAQASGTYQPSATDDNAIDLGNGVTAYINADGQLVVNSTDKTEMFYAQYSYVGVWKASNITIELLGIQQNGVGKAILNYGDDMFYDLVYEASETNGYVCLYWPHEQYTKDTLFGYFYYDTATNTLLATLSDSNNLDTGYTQGNLFITDDYNGEWISDDNAFADVEFSFNGNGLYGFLYGYAGMEGTLTLRDLTTDKRIELTYTLDSTLKGHFAYDGIRYVMEYDEDAKAVRLTANGVVSNLERKDALAGMNFVDMDGNSYHFDGRSTLLTGGTLTVNGEVTYPYTEGENGWIIRNGNEEIGTISLASNKAYYDLTLNGATAQLYLYNDFIGEWAIGGQFGMMKIGPTDLFGKIQANFKGYAVEITTLQPNFLTFEYKDNNMPITYYLTVVKSDLLNDNILVLSEYLMMNEYFICTKAHALHGEWVSGNGEFTFRFDGIYSTEFESGDKGIAELYRNTPSHTDYYYRTTAYGITLWSQTVLGGKTQYYEIVMLDVETLTDEEKTSMNIFMKKDENGNILAAFKRVEADGLIFLTATDDDGNNYFFDGKNANGNLGNLYVNDEAMYSYKIKSYNDDSTATLELTRLEDGVMFSATLDYSQDGVIRLIIGEIIEENAD